ncbi:cytochrome P450 [Aspergillus homomorphus CBS 101889]|uniref:Cytochrome P450 n=1 Tax=Aspergillus homomorphus (strain CBS 101889) TaxID=1450537 RepID=A0A395I0G2_ASPHC|nr:cytochrome P450 [Aspergillus homomorphus CBS 101889]RAL13169.1 cytochrome P450 [Aspergillus homomorphus CBS 101889]
MSFLPYVFIPITLLACWRLLSTRYNRLRHIPGPWLASCSNLWKLATISRGDMHTECVANHDRYGPIVRIGPHHVSVASPESFYTVHASTKAFAKSDIYEVGAPTYRGKRLENLFSIRDVNHHATLRKNLGSLYTKGAVRSLEPLVDSCVDLFIHRLRDLCKHGPATVDMSLWLHLYAYDSLAEVNVSQKLGFLQKGDDVGGMIGAANRIFYMVGLLTQAPFLHALFKILRTAVPAEKVEPLIEYTFNIVEQRLSSPTADDDMLNKMLKLHEAQPQKVTIHELTSAIFINLMAGHDVLAVTLRAMWYFLAQNPPVLQKLRNELQAAAAERSTSVQGLTAQDLSSLPYLGAVILETFRMHPTTGTILERRVPAEGATLEGHFLPGGTTVGVNAWVLHRNRQIFGQDTDIYRPERWLEASAERKTEMNRNLFTFGAGPRTCIGQNIAMIQIYKVVAGFFDKFDVKLANPNRPWKVTGSWVTKQIDMDMIVTPRGL